MCRTQYQQSNYYNNNINICQLTINETRTRDNVSKLAQNQTALHTLLTSHNNVCETMQEKRAEL